MRHAAYWLLFLLTTATFAQADRSVMIVSSATALTAALRHEDIVWLKLSARQLDEDQAAALRDWVARGGTAWTETDVVGLFGFRYSRASVRERIGHGRRACLRGATPLAAEVDDVFYRLGDGAVLLASHPSALPLLRVIDSPVSYRGSRYAAATLWYGRGEIIHRPAELHPRRADGAQFESNLLEFSGGRESEAVIPVDMLRVAQARAAEAVELLDRDPDKAKSILYQVFLAHRLWYAEHLTASGDLDEALAQLSAVAADLPEDPAVYLAVARLNDALGRTNAADEARRKALEKYRELRRDPPGRDARQVRVPWPLFVACINAAGAAWENPSATAAAEVVARTTYLVGFDEYRRNNWAASEKLWLTAARQAPSWPPPQFHLGLLYYSRGENIRQANRQRVELFGRAASYFRRAAATTPSVEFTAEAVGNAADWATVSATTAATLRGEPPDAQIHDHFVFRYDSADRRLQVGPLLPSLLTAFDQAYQATTRWGMHLDDTEILIYPDVGSMRGALPPTGTGQQAFAAAATVERRIYAAARSNEIGRIARHEFTHVVANALTEGGLPAPLWFEEGLAAAMEDFPARSQAAGVNIRRGRALSIEQLNDPRIFYRRDVADQAYGQSELMVEALVGRFGADVIVAYLQACGWGTAPDAAFRSLTGMTQGQFLAAFLQGRLGR